MNLFETIRATEYSRQTRDVPSVVEAESSVRW